MEMQGAKYIVPGTWPKVKARYPVPGAHYVTTWYSENCWTPVQPIFTFLSRSHLRRLLQKQCAADKTQTCQVEFTSSREFKFC